MKTLLKTPLLFLSLSLSFAASGWAQTAPALPVLASELRKFLQFDDGALALTHARVIDGNGGAAQEDRIVIVRNGKLDVCSSSKDILSSWEKMEISSPQ